MNAKRHRYNQTIIPFWEKWSVKTEANQFEDKLGMVCEGGGNG